GGRVIVWADGDTRFFGSISARGGRESGNGGFVETSGKQALQAFGRVDTGAPNGKSGIWLLDPYNLHVVSGTGSEDTLIGATGAIFSGQGPSESSVSAGSIEAYAGNVILEATHDVSFETDITKTTGGLSATAGHDVLLND